MKPQLYICLRQHHLQPLNPQPVIAVAQVDYGSSLSSRLQTSSQQTPSTFAFVEMDQYLKAPLLPRKEDPLQWWHDNSHIYPTIAKVASKYLSMLVTSVLSKRLFGKAGEVISQRRSSPKPKMWKPFFF